MAAAAKADGAGRRAGAVSLPAARATTGQMFRNISVVGTESELLHVALFAVGRRTDEGLTLYHPPPGTCAGPAIDRMIRFLNE